jgi:hypothetical protein
MVRTPRADRSHRAEGQAIACQRADTERQRADRLAEKRRELGIAPEVG